jgi:hypothetical protein
MQELLERAHADLNKAHSHLQHRFKETAMQLAQARLLLKNHADASKADKALAVSIDSVSAAAALQGAYAPTFADDIEPDSLPADPRLSDAAELPCLSSSRASRQATGSHAGDGALLVPRSPAHPLVRTAYTPMPVQRSRSVKGGDAALAAAQDGARRAAAAAAAAEARALAAEAAAASSVAALEEMRRHITAGDTSAATDTYLAALEVRALSKDAVVKPLLAAVHACISVACVLQVQLVEHCTNLGQGFSRIRPV